MATECPLDANASIVYSNTARPILQRNVYYGIFVKFGVRICLELSLTVEIPTPRHFCVYTADREYYEWAWKSMT